MTNWEWWCMGPDQWSVDPTDKPVGSNSASNEVCATFTEAKRKLMACLLNTKDAYQHAANELRTMRKEQFL